MIAAAESEGQSGPATRRVLVALDPMDQCGAALETAARLAARSRAELVGLFVEEGDLVQAAALPVTGLVRGHDFHETRFDPQSITRGLKVWAARAEANLNAAARRWRVKASFHVARGQVGEILSAEAGRNDLVALGTVARPSGTARIGATARLMVHCPSCPVLVMRAPGRRGAPVLTLFAGGERSLVLGAELAALFEVPLTILAIDSEQEAAATAWARERDLPVRILRAAEGADEADLVQEIDQRAPAFAVLDRTADRARDIDPERVLSGPAGAVLVVG